MDDRVFMQWKELPLNCVTCIRFVAEQAFVHGYTSFSLCLESPVFLTVDAGRYVCLCFFCSILVRYDDVVASPVLVSC